MKFKYYTDPGHGWMAVKVKDIYKYGLQYKISAYSYLRGGTAYLEEDCDMPLFLQRLKDLGIAYELEYKSTDKQSPIRSYDRYTDGAADKIYWKETQGL